MYGITLAQTAEKLGIHPVTLSRLFSSNLGVSFTQHVNSLRANSAAKLLASGSSTVTEAGFAAGYGSIRSFNRSFKICFGTTPKKFARRVSGEKTMLTLLYAALFLSVGAGLFTQKKYGKSVSSAADLSMYSMITGIIACIFFWCSGGFVLAYNMRTVLYSAVYAVIVLASQFLLLVLYKRSGIAKTTVISSSAALFMTWGLGLLLFSEKFSAISAFRCLLMIAAGVLIARPETADSAAKSAPKAAGLRNTLMAALLGLTETCAALLSKILRRR